MKKLFLSSLSVNLFIMIINLITGILSARYLGAYGRGELAIATRWPNLFILLFTFGLPGALTFLGKKNNKEQSSYLSAYFILNAIIGPVGLIIGFIVFPMIISNQPASIINMAKISLLALPFAIMSHGLIGSLQGINKFKHVMAIKLMTPFGIVTIILVLIFAGKYNVYNFIVITTLLNVLICIISLLMVLKFIKPTLNNTLNKTKELTKRGIQIYGYSITSSFGNQMDQLVISLVLSPFILGLYTVAVSIRNMLISLIHGAISVYLMPKLMDLKGTERYMKVERIHGTLFYGTFFVSIFLSSVLPLVIPLIYGKEFVDSIIMGVILLSSVPFSIGNAILVNFLTAEAKFHRITCSEILGIIVGLIVTVLLYRFMGGEAAALGVVSSSIAKWIVNLHASCKIGVNYRSLFTLYIDSYKSLLQVLLSVIYINKVQKHKSTINKNV